MRLLLLTLTAILLQGCSTPNIPREARYEFTEPHMGTLWTITLFASSEMQARTAAHAAFAEINRLEQIITDYNPASELRQLSNKPSNVPHAVSPELYSLLEQSQAISRLSQGAFDITIGPEIQLWRRARRQRALPPPEVLVEAISRVGYEKVKLDPRERTVELNLQGMYLDAGGIGKGFAADAALRILRQNGTPRALVAASGDLAIGSAPPGAKGWTVTVAPPNQCTNCHSIALRLSNASVSTSGDAEQFVELGGERYSHIVNPRTGVGLTNHLQTTVIAPNTTLSDSLATAFCILGTEASMEILTRNPKIDAVFFSQRGEVARSAGVARYLTR